MIYLRDVGVEIGGGHSAQLESWLLGQGRIPAVLPDHPTGSFRYLVKAANRRDIGDIELVGGRILKREGRTS